MYSESKYLVSWRVMTSLWPSWLSRAVHLIYSRISAVPSDDKYFAKSEQSSWVCLQKRRLLTTEIWCRPSIFMFTENEQQCFRIVRSCTTCWLLCVLLKSRVSAAKEHTHTSVCKMTLCCGMCLANILNLDMFVIAVEEVAQFSVHIPVTYKNVLCYILRGTI